MCVLDDDDKPMQGPPCEPRGCDRRAPESDRDGPHGRPWHRLWSSRRRGTGATDPWLRRYRPLVKKLLEDPFLSTSFWRDPFNPKAKGWGAADAKVEPLGVNAARKLIDQLVLANTRAARRSTRRGTTT